MRLSAALEIHAYGTSEGVEKSWDTRGRGRAWNAQAQGTYGKTNPKTGILYHGTSAPKFNTFRKGLAYFTNESAEAYAYAVNPIIGGGRGEGRPRVHIVRLLNLDKAKDISSVLDERMGEGDDPDDIINEEAEKAKSEGYRHIGFFHPGSYKDEIPVTVSMYPDEDTKMFKSEYPTHLLKDK